MTDFEREVVHCLNHFFKTHQIQGFAHRIRQLTFTSGSVNVLADSLNPSYNLAIECKSILDKKLYFSQHFRVGRDKVHQVDAITEFLAKTDRIGYLAVEFRQGPTEASEAFLIPWPAVVGYFQQSNGITMSDARSWIVLFRSKNGYRIESLNAK